MVFRVGILVILMLFSNMNLIAQCCSQSCSMTSANGSGLLEEKHLEVTTFYKHNYSDKYMRGKELYDFKNADLALKNSYFDFMGLNIGYGITNNLMVEVQGGYFGNKTQNFNNGAWLIGNGISDFAVTLKLNIFHSNDSIVNVVFNSGVKLPTGSYNDYTPEGVRLSRDVQSGNGAFSGIGGFSMGILILKKHRITVSSEFEYVGINPEEYQVGYGNTNYISSFIKLSEKVSFIALVKNENRTNDYYYDLKQKSTGYVKVSALPGISCELPLDLAVIATAELPVYQYFNGLQFAPKYGVTFSLRKTFELHRHEPKQAEKAL